MNLEIKYLNKESMQLESIRGDEIEDQLDKIKQVLEYALKEMSQLGDYTLNEFTAKVGSELGAWILTADGSIALTWKKPDK